MKKICTALMVAAGLCLLITAAFAGEDPRNPGRKLFKLNCAVCHPNGENVSIRTRIFTRKTLENTE